MIYKEYEMKVCLEAKTANEMNELYEAYIRMVGKYSPTGDMFYQDGQWRAIIKYKVEEKEPETKADEYKLKGIEYVCGDCPYFQLNHDRRIKYSICGEGNKVSYCDKACDYLYEQIETGAIEL